MSMTFRARFENLGRAVRACLSAHFRLVEVAGLMIITATAALEYRAIRVDERLLSGLNSDLIADWSVWNTAMPQHMHWVEYAVERIPNKDKTVPQEQDKLRRFGGFLTNYVVYITTANSLLFEERRSLVKFELDSGLANPKLVRECDDAVQRVSEDTGALAAGELSQSLSTKSSSEDIERFAKTVGQSPYIAQILQAATACGRRRESNFEALVDRKERRATFYVAIFLVGSCLLGIGKYGNWLNDCDKARKA